MRFPPWSTRNPGLVWPGWCTVPVIGRRYWWREGKGPFCVREYILHSERQSLLRLFKPKMRRQQGLVPNHLLQRMNQEYRQKGLVKGIQAISVTGRNEPRCHKSVCWDVRKKNTFLLPCIQKWEVLHCFTLESDLSEKRPLSNSLVEQSVWIFVWSFIHQGMYLRTVRVS